MIPAFNFRGFCMVDGGCVACIAPFLFATFKLIFGQLFSFVGDFLHIFAC